MLSFDHKEVCYEQSVSPVSYRSMKRTFCVCVWNKNGICFALKQLLIFCKLFVRMRQH